MRCLPVLLAGLGCFVLGGCATLSPVAPPPGLAAVVDSDADASSYGQFLAGQAAVNHGENAAAAAYFGNAASLGGGSDETLLATRTFTAALLAGDVGRAAAVAPTGPEVDVGVRRLGALARAVEALASDKGRLAWVILAGPDAGAASEPAAALLTPFAAAAAGDAEASIRDPVIKNAPIAQFFAYLDQGKLFERARRYGEAETAFRALVAKGDPGGIASLDLGEMLERRGRGDEAVAIYNAALARKADSAELVSARARAMAHRPPPPLPLLRTAAAGAMMAPAAAMLSDKQDELALAYLRLALRLDPTRDEAWMMVGDILTTNQDEPGAREAFGKVAPASGQYLAARARLAWSHHNAGDNAAALAVARETLARRPGAPEALTNLADLLRVDQRYDESAKVLDGLIGASPESADWKLLYMRAVDEDASGHWDAAERDLRIALRQRPDEAELLNFLGYSWIDRGVRLPEAIAMVQKAVNLQPQSGAMIDSLGWGYYKLGDYPAAVEKLEAAIVLEPGDPDVNNHLGDAYWRVGRKVEATFQWRRVLTLDPSVRLKAEVEAKLAAGSPAVPAAPRVAS